MQKDKFYLNSLPLIIFLLIVSCKSGDIKISSIAEGWSNNSVNAVIFRRNSLVTHKDIQYAAFYDKSQNVVLAKRKTGSSQWITRKTKFRGNAKDAHNAISIMVDGDGYLHIAWDHHNNPLRYSRSIAPGSLTLADEMEMTGFNEGKVTYPEFYSLPDGDLIFLYRSGASGNGDLIINRYNTATQQWVQEQNNLIDGEKERNAYWQAHVDKNGTIHLSWVWRETWDVATNHDLSYARSEDGGKTWENSKGEKYDLPVTINTAEVAWHIPQKSELINQTSMAADDRGNPVIATYWREKDSDIPQIRVVYYDGENWQHSQVTNRTTPFTLSGGGTKRIPVSRPQIVLRRKGDSNEAAVIFRDEERGNKISVSLNEDFPDGEWNIIDLSEENVGQWEPTFDTRLWNERQELHIFMQKVEQQDSEGLSDRKPEEVKVLEWDMDN